MLVNKPFHNALIYNALRCSRFYRAGVPLAIHFVHQKSPVSGSFAHKKKREEIASFSLKTGCLFLNLHHNLFLDT